MPETDPQVFRKSLNTPLHESTSSNVVSSNSHFKQKFSGGKRIPYIYSDNVMIIKEQEEPEIKIKTRIPRKKGINYFAKFENLK